MSWMDSWSRPSANSKTPAPLYLSQTEVPPYCHTCGRVMTTKKSLKNSQEIKYCSDRCRSRKPGAKDRAIEQSIAALLNGDQESGIETTAAKSKLVKGDPRMIVTCDEIETVIFGSRFDPEKVYGRRKNRKSRALRDDKEWRSVDMESSSDSEDESADMQVYGEVPLQGEAPPDADCIPLPFHVSHIRPSQMQSEINFSAGGGERSKVEKIEESASDLERRLEGAKRAEEREMVRRAARRVIIFGVEIPRKDKATKFTPTTKDKSKRTKRGSTNLDEEQEANLVSEGEVRKAEALMNGVVVEPSFAKGNWSVRWRE